MKTIRKIISGFVLGVSVGAVAEPLPQTAAEQAGESLQQQPWLQSLEADGTGEKQPAPERKGAAPVVVRNQDLREHPELLAAMLRQAVDARHEPLLGALLPAYLALPQAQQDAKLRQHTQAELARLRGDYPTATAHYQAVQQQYPDDVRLQLDTAATLTEDRQWREAEALFAQAAQTPELPDVVAENIRLYRNGIRQNAQWQVQGGVQLSYDKNINDAPQAYCTPLGCVRERQENAWGLRYRVYAEKNTPIRGHHNLLFRMNASGTTYYLSQRSAYDYALARASLGYRFQDARQSLEILPFYQAQFSGSRQFPDKAPRQKRVLPYMLGHAVGVQAAFERQLAPKWTGFVSLEGMRQDFREEERARHQNGTVWNAFASLSYRIRPQHLLFAGYGWGSLHPGNGMVGGRANSSGYVRHSVQAGWLAQWTALGNLNTEIRGQYTQRRYRGSALDTAFLRRPQRNNERSLTVALSYPKWRVWGAVPKLVWQENRIDSTHDWADRRQRNVWLEWEKRF